MTPIVMGAGYLAATWYFYRLGSAKHWFTVSSVLGGVLTFTITMLVSTLLHWERFSHGKFTCWLWLTVYALSPLAVDAVLLMHRRHQDTPVMGTSINGGGRAVFALVALALPGAQADFVSPAKRNGFALVLGLRLLIEKAARRAAQIPIRVGSAPDGLLPRMLQWSLSLVAEIGRIKTSRLMILCPLLPFVTFYLA